MDEEARNIRRLKNKSRKARMKEKIAKKLHAKKAYAHLREKGEAGKPARTFFKNGTIWIESGNIFPNGMVMSSLGLARLLRRRHGKKSYGDFGPIQRLPGGARGTEVGDLADGCIRLTATSWLRVGAPADLVPKAARKILERTKNTDDTNQYQLKSAGVTSLQEALNKLMDANNSHIDINVITKYYRDCLPKPEWQQLVFDEMTMAKLAWHLENRGDGCWNQTAGGSGTFHSGVRVGSAPNQIFAGGAVQSTSSSRGCTFSNSSTRVYNYNDAPGAADLHPVGSSMGYQCNAGGDQSSCGGPSGWNCNDYDEGDEIGDDDDDDADDGEGDVDGGQDESGDNDGYCQQRGSTHFGGQKTADVSRFPENTYADGNVAFQTAFPSNDNQYNNYPNNMNDNNSGVRPYGRGFGRSVRPRGIRPGNVGYVDYRQPSISQRGMIRTPGSDGWGYGSSDRAFYGAGGRGGGVGPSLGRGYGSNGSGGYGSNGSLGYGATAVPQINQSWGNQFS